MTTRRSTRRKVTAAATETQHLHSQSELHYQAFLLLDEDGAEFERDLLEAMEGLSVSATTNRLSKVQVIHFSALKQISSSVLILFGKIVEMMPLLLCVTGVKALFVS